MKWERQDGVWLGGGEVEALDSNERATLITAAASLQEWASDELLACPTLPLDGGAADVFSQRVMDPPEDSQIVPPPLSLNTVAL